MTQATKTTPVLGTYYCPGSQHHPWIDRACIARDICLVLYQDKINAAGFPAAVTSLNKAAKMLGEGAFKNTPVLCVVDAIGAGETIKQDGLNFPYLLIKSGVILGILDYTVQFSPAIQFLKNRHLQYCRRIMFSWHLRANGLH